MNIVLIRYISAIITLALIGILLYLWPNESMDKISSYASTFIGILGVHITFETLSLAKSIKEQRSSTSLKQTLASIIGCLSANKKLSSRPVKEDISRVCNFANLLEKNKSINSDSEVKEYIEIMKSYKEEYPESNREIIDVLNQIQSIIV